MAVERAREPFCIQLFFDSLKDASASSGAACTDSIPSALTLCNVLADPETNKKCYVEL